MIVKNNYNRTVKIKSAMIFLYMLLNILIWLIFLALGLFVGGKFSRYATTAAGVGLIIIFSQAFLYFHPEYEVLIFSSADYVYFRWWSIAGAFLLTGASADNVSPENKKAVWFFAAISLAAGAYLYHQTIFMACADFNESGFAKGLCIQSTGYTCAPASCATLLNIYGVHATEKEMSGLCLTEKRGTNYVKVFRGLKLKLAADDYEVRIEQKKFDELKLIPPPFLTSIYIMNGKISHMICVLNASTDEVYFADSLLAEKRTLKKDDFAKNWDEKVVYIRKN